MIEADGFYRSGTIVIHAEKCVSLWESTMNLKVSVNGKLTQMFRRKVQIRVYGKPVKEDWEHEWREVKVEEP